HQAPPGKTPGPRVAPEGGSLLPAAHRPPAPLPRPGHDVAAASVRRVPVPALRPRRLPRGPGHPPCGARPGRPGPETPLERPALRLRPDLLGPAGPPGTLPPARPARRGRQRPAGRFPRADRPLRFAPALRRRGGFHPPRRVRAL